MITKNTLPNGEWRNYSKKTATRMLRMNGPFEVQTREGVVVCEDGFLAIDAEGYPYPVSLKVHEQTYIDMGPV